VDVRVGGGRVPLVDVWPHPTPRTAATHATCPRPRDAVATSPHARHVHTHTHTPLTLPPARMLRRLAEVLRVIQQDRRCAPHTQRRTSMTHPSYPPVRWLHGSCMVLASRAVARGPPHISSIACHSHHHQRAPPTYVATHTRRHTPRPSKDSSRQRTFGARPRHSPTHQISSNLESLPRRRQLRRDELVRALCAVAHAE